jgi:zinc D-Ala-D-Ala carboxypeptidase
MKISKHITLAEAIHSNTAKRCGIDNLPNEEQTNNMKMLAEKIFEPLRLWVGGPIKINSMFRSEKLNKAIGGASSSQHCKGLAMDLDDVYGHKTNAEMYEWIHVSYISVEKNRNRKLLAEKEFGKTTYKIIK